MAMRRRSLSTNKKLRAIREMPSFSPMRPTTARLRAGGTEGEVRALRNSGEPVKTSAKLAQIAQQLVRVHA